MWTRGPRAVVDTRLPASRGDGAAPRSSRDPRSPRAFGRLLAAGLAFALASSTLLVVMVPVAAGAGTYTVNTTIDAHDADAGNGACATASTACSLRAAVEEASALGGATTIFLPAGMYDLSLGDLLAGGSVPNTTISIAGAGASSTTVRQTQPARSVFIHNQTMVPDVVLQLSNMTITGGQGSLTDPDGFGGGGAINGGGSTGSLLVVDHVTFTGNSAIDNTNGGAIEWTGGGDVIVTNSTFHANTTGRPGGFGYGNAIDFEVGNAPGNLTIANSTFDGNWNAGAQGSGGAIYFAGTNSVATISRSVFTGNYAPERGGAIEVGSGHLDIHTSRIVGNFAPIGSGIAVRNLATSLSTAIDNWWGCNEGPGAFGCDGTALVGGDGTGLVVTAPWLVLNAAADPDHIRREVGTTVTASMTRDSSGNVIASSDLVAVAALPVSWGSTTGDVFASQPMIGADGTATTGYASSTCGAGAATASVDHATAGAPIFIDCPDLVVTKTSSVPSGPVVGEQWTWTFDIENAGADIASFAPGDVVLDDALPIGSSLTYGPADADPLSCSIAADHFRCVAVTPFTFLPGGHLLIGLPVRASSQQTLINPTGGTCSVNPDSTIFESSYTNNSCGPVGVTVGQAATTTSFESTPSSVTGETVTFSFGLDVVAPGSGTPTGTVTLTDSAGAAPCIAAVSDGECSLTFPAAGPRTLTLTYSGDADFGGSTASTSYVVQPAATTVSITSAVPEPSVTGQTVAVHFSVVPTAPGAGTPTGPVTVSAGTDTCSAPVAAGECSLQFSTAGPKTLTAAYAGDSNFAAGQSTASHTVDAATTTTTILGHGPSPSVFREPVTVSFAVLAALPGVGTPTGSVTVSDGTAACTATVAAGQCDLVPASAGARTLVATYGGDGSFGGSTSSGVPHTVLEADTSTAIVSASPDPTVTGQPVHVAFSVTSASGTPAGIVTVTAGTATCTASVAAGSCDLAIPHAGSTTIAASYGGNGNFNASTSGAVAHLVNASATVTTITSDDPDPSVVGVPLAVHFTVTPSSPGSGTPTGTVTVSAGSASCTADATDGACQVTPPSIGSYTISAAYAGNADFLASSDTEAHEVGLAPTVTTISGADPLTSVSGQPVTFHFSVTSATGSPAGDVSVTDGVESCSASVAAGECALTFATAGVRTVTASYAGSGTFAASAGSVSHTVSAAATVTSIVSHSPDPSEAGVAVDVAFSVVVAAPGAGTPTGAVTVSDGTASCTATVAAGHCSLTLAGAGAHTLTATYAGDGNFASSTSPGVVHTVSGSASTPSPSASATATPTSTATATPTSTATATPSGAATTTPSASPGATASPTPSASASAPPTPRVTPPPTTPRRGGPAPSRGGLPLGVLALLVACFVSCVAVALPAAVRTRDGRGNRPRR